MSWYVARWGGLFVVTYLLARESGSPLVIQAAGALLFVPLLFGGFLGGLLTHRYDSWRLVIGSLLVLCLALGAMSAVALAGQVPLWLLFPFILLVGLGQLVNMTVHRDVLFEVVGTHHSRHALVVEAVQVSSSMAVGNVVAGALIELGGQAAAFGGLLLLHLIALSCFRRIRPASSPSVPRASTASVAAQWAVTLRVLRRSRNLRLALTITVVMNSFVYGYISLVPLLVGRFDSSALAVSLLAAGDGLGQVCAGLVLTALGIRRPGVVLAAGAIITSSSILVFSQASTPGTAFIALVAAGIGTAGYAATQTVAALRDAEADERGAVLGLVSTAIGATPLGMLLMGSLASAMPAESALAVTASIGLSAVLAVTLRGRTTLSAS